MKRSIPKEPIYSFDKAITTLNLFRTVFYSSSVIMYCYLIATDFPLRLSLFGIPYALMMCYFSFRVDKVIQFVRKNKGNRYDSRRMEGN